MDQDLIKKVIDEKSKDSSWWTESEKKVISRYGPIFIPKNLNKLTKEDFKSFLLIKNNLHWEGIHRQGNIVTADIDALRLFLKYVLDETIPIEKRLNTEFIESGGLWVKGIGRAIISAILLVVYPEKYGVWNTKSENALKKLGFLPAFQRNDRYGDKYKKINNVLLELANTYNISLWQLDGVLGDIVGTSPFTGEVLTDEEGIERELKEHGIEDPVVFGMEKHLEEFLIANWEKTIFGDKYTLLYNEGKELASQQYSTDIGFIDILVKSKDEKEYLVIELKKGRTSDAIVGQILRYMSWVEEKIANGNDVKGAIVILDTDEKLRYSLKNLKDVTLYTYEVNFKLNKKL